MSDEMLNNTLSDIRSDIKHIRENMVSYREYDHLHNEFHNTKAEVDLLVKAHHSTAYLRNIGSKFVYVIVGGVLASILKLVGFTEGLDAWL